MPSRGIPPLRVRLWAGAGVIRVAAFQDPAGVSSAFPPLQKGRIFGVFEMSLFQRFRKNESGATAVEYGLIIALIAAVSVGTIKTIGTNLNTKFNIINSNLN